MASVPNLRTSVLLRSEQSGGQVSMIENVIPAQSAGPPLHTHHFDEAFYMLEGELIFQVEVRALEPSSSCSTSSRRTRA